MAWQESAVWSFVVAHPVAAISLVFLMDGLGVPLMPELAALFAFAQSPGLGWGALLVLVITLIEVAAAGILYGAVALFGVPGWLGRLMRGYAGNLLVRDERLLLLNRVVPVLPVAGAFVRVSGWRPARSFLFIAVGSVVKYGTLLSVSGLAYHYFSGPWPVVVSLSAAALFLAASSAWSLRRWLQARQARPGASGP